MNTYSTLLFLLILFCAQELYGQPDISLLKPIDLDTTSVPSDLELIHFGQTDDAALLYFAPPFVSNSSTEPRLFLRTKDSAMQVYPPLRLDKVIRIMPFGSHFIFEGEAIWGVEFVCFLNRYTLEITILPEEYSDAFYQVEKPSAVTVPGTDMILFHTHHRTYYVMSPSDPTNPQPVLSNAGFIGFTTLSNGTILCVGPGGIYRFSGMDTGMEHIYTTPNGVYYDEIIHGDSLAYFYDSGGTLVASNGSAAGTHLLHSRDAGGVQAFRISGISVVNDVASYFIEYSEGLQHFHTPWRTDGTTAGTVQVLDEEAPNFFKTRGTNFRFSGQNALAWVENGEETEIYYTDFTSENTRKVWDEGEAGLGNVTDVFVSILDLEETLFLTIGYYVSGFFRRGFYALDPAGAAPTFLGTNSITVYGQWSEDGTWFTRIEDSLFSYDATSQQFTPVSTEIMSLTGGAGSFVEYNGGFLYRRGTNSLTELYYLATPDAEPLGLGFETRGSLFVDEGRIFRFDNNLVITDFEEGRPKRFITIDGDDITVEIEESLFQPTNSPRLGRELFLLGDHLATASNDMEGTFFIANRGDLVINYPYQFLPSIANKNHPVTEEIDDYLIIEDNPSQYIYLPKSFDAPPEIYSDKPDESSPGLLVQYGSAIQNGKHYYLSMKSIDFERIECDTLTIEETQFITCDTLMVSEYEYTMNWYDPLADTVSRRVLDTLTIGENFSYLKVVAAEGRIYFTLPYPTIAAFDFRAVYEFDVEALDFRSITVNGQILKAHFTSELKATENGMICNGATGGINSRANFWIPLGQTEAIQLEDYGLGWYFFEEDFVTSTEATFLSGKPGNGWSRDTSRIVVLPIEGEAIIRKEVGDLVLLEKDENAGAIYGYNSEDSLAVYRASTEGVTLVKKVKFRTNADHDRYIAYKSGRVYYVSYEDEEYLNFLDVSSGVTGIIPTPNFAPYLPFRALTVLNNTLYLIAKNNEIGSELFYLDESGTRLVSGRMYRNPVEQDTVGIEHYPITLTGATITQAFTDIDGKYGFLVNTQDEYELAIGENECGQMNFDVNSIMILPGEENVSQDFAFTADTGDTEIEMEIAGARLRCNTEVPHWITVHNSGCADFTGIVQVALPAGVMFIASPDAPVSIEDNLILFEVEELAPFDRLTLHLLLEMPDETATGTSLAITATAIDRFESIIATTTEAEVLRCAYDPNDKAVSPVRPDPENNNYTLWDEELKYTIRFQNTGNDTAITVRLVDWLDPELDWTTLRPLAASHPYKTELDEHGKLTFLFENIMLPDSNVNEPASHGFVRFSILPKSTADFGINVENTAYIYFDFNQPIITNTVRNKLVEFIDEDMDGYPFWEDCQDDDAFINPGAAEIFGNGIDENCDGDDFITSLATPVIKPVSVFPNPVKDELHVVGTESSQLIARLFSVQGAFINQSTGLGQTKLSLGALPAGSYYLVVLNNRGQNLYSGLIIHNN